MAHDVPIKTGTPIHVPHFRKKKGPIDVPGSLILRPMFAAHPYNHFCTEYPPPGLKSSNTSRTTLLSSRDCMMLFLTCSKAVSVEWWALYADWNISPRLWSLHVLYDLTWGSLLNDFSNEFDIGHRSILLRIFGFIVTFLIISVIIECLSVSGKNTWHKRTVYNSAGDG